MSGINKVMILGNLGKNPEIKHLESGVSVASFSVATTENFKDKATGEKKEQTEWHNVVAWRGTADSVEKSELKKGDRVFIEGKIKSRKWQDKDGNQRQVTEIVADSFTIISRKKVDEAVPSIADNGDF